MKQAYCPKCSNFSFTITDQHIRCRVCGKLFEFDFVDDAKSICTTNANDIVLLINEGK